MAEIAALQNRLCRFEFFAEAAHGAEVAHAGGGFAEVQRRGDVAVGHEFEMAHQDDFAVLLVELFDRGLEAALEFVPSGFGGGSKLRIGQCGGQIECRLIDRAGGERLFAIDAAAGRAAVAAVGVDQAILGHLAEPEVEGDRGILRDNRSGGGWLR